MEPQSVLKGPPVGKCPECRYRLKGLPDKGKCPECGFDYDPHTARVATARLWRPLFLFPAAPMVFAVVTFRQNPLSSVLFFLFGLGLTGILVYLSPRFIVSPNGVRFVGLKKSIWFAWDRIENVTVGGHFGKFKIIGDSGKTLFWILNVDIGGRAFARRMKKILDDKREVYRSVSDAPPTE